MEYLHKLKQQGQSAVEYILLLAVATSLVTFIIKSDGFKKIFGKDGQFATVYKAELEYSYRHALSSRKKFKKPSYKSGQHDSYAERFFGSKDAYPQ